MITALGIARKQNVFPLEWELGKAGLGIQLPLDGMDGLATVLKIESDSF